MTELIGYQCERCGVFLRPGMKVCPNCGALVYRRRLEQLAADAMRVEAVNPRVAALIWRQCLDLLPRESRQFQVIAERVGALSVAADGAGAPAVFAEPMDGDARYHQPEPTVRPPDSWPLAVAKTGGSMLLSILCYMILPFGETVGSKVAFAVGFALLILVHELGHVFAMRHYGLSASPPIFIPFLGALINMRQPPQNAKVEAVVGIGGPLLGTVGAFVPVALHFGLNLPPGSPYAEVIHFLAYFGVLINLFNLLPFPPLDGGRITAALSPWLWLLGVAGIGVLIYVGQIPLFLAVLILFFGLPRVIGVLQSRRGRHSYYDVSAAAAWSIGTLYVGLAVLLVALSVSIGRPDLVEEAARRRASADGAPPEPAVQLDNSAPGTARRSVSIAN